MSEEFESAGMGNEITDDDKLWALLGYIIPIVALIALLMEDKKDRPFIRYHAVHSLALAVFAIILSWTICGGIIPYVYGIYLGIQAYGGEMPEVPWLTEFARGQGWI